MKKATFVFALFTIGVFFVIWMFQEKVVRVSESPNGRYLLVVLKRNFSTIPVMPGQGSDAKGSVELRERGSGHVISRRKLDMLQDIEEIQWKENEVWINSRCAILYGDRK